MSRAAHGRPGPGRPPSRRRTATFVILQANYQYGDRGCHHDHAPFRFLIVNAGVQVDAFDHNDSEGGWTQIFAFKLLCWCIIAFGARNCFYAHRRHARACQRPGSLARKAVTHSSYHDRLKLLGLFNEFQCIWAVSASQFHMTRPNSMTRNCGPLDRDPLTH